MQNNDLVDIYSLAQRLQKEGPATFSRWASTAHEIAREEYKAIERVRHDYSTLHKDELSLLRYELFINAILDTMPTLENKKTLLCAEALSERKFLK
jgi:hypothetical protein